MNDSPAFARLLDALSPWLGQVVIVGGWAHRLHRFHPLSHSPTYEPIRTKDADVALPTFTPLAGDIATALKDAGFHEELYGEERPPVTQYRLGGDDQGFLVEFLVPLYGSPTKRGGQRDVTTAKAGITAQKLRHLELLLLNPYKVRLTKKDGLSAQSPVDVMIPNPVSFIAQKVLIQKYRRPEKQAQDALYIHDTLELFGGALSELSALWQQKIRPGLSKPIVDAIESLTREQFGTVTDVIRDAVRIPQDRRLEPDRMQAACEYGLQQIFS